MRSSTMMRPHPVVRCPASSHVARFCIERIESRGQRRATGGAYRAVTGTVLGIRTCKLTHRGCTACYHRREASMRIGNRCNHRHCGPLFSGMQEYAERDLDSTRDAPCDVVQATTGRQVSCRGRGPSDRTRPVLCHQGAISSCDGDGIPPITAAGLRLMMPTS